MVCLRRAGGYLHRRKAYPTTAYSAELLVFTAPHTRHSLVFQCLEQRIRPCFPRFFPIEQVMTRSPIFFSYCLLPSYRQYEEVVRRLEKMTYDDFVEHISKIKPDDEVAPGMGTDARERSFIKHSSGVPVPILTLEGVTFFLNDHDYTLDQKRGVWRRILNLNVDAHENPGVRTPLTAENCFDETMLAPAEGWVARFGCLSKPYVNDRTTTQMVRLNTLVRWFVLIIRCMISNIQALCGTMSLVR